MGLLALALAIDEEAGPLAGLASAPAPAETCLATIGAGPAMVGTDIVLWTGLAATGAGTDGPSEELALLVELAFS